MTSPPPSLPSRILLGALVLVGYVAIANAVQQLYPFSVFDMYAHQATSASHVGARLANGDLSDVTAWDNWRCVEPIDLLQPQTDTGPQPYTIPYRDREAQEWLLAHRGQGTQSVDVVRHIWWLVPQPGHPEVEDRVLLHCQAERK